MQRDVREREEDQRFASPRQHHTKESPPRLMDLHCRYFFSRFRSAFHKGSFIIFQKKKQKEETYPTDLEIAVDTILR